GVTHSVFSAAAMGDADALRALAAAGIDCNQPMDRTNHRRTPLHLAVAKRQPAAVAALIDLGVDLDRADAGGLTPLDQVAVDGDDDMTRQLIAAGARITLPAAIALERGDEVDRLLGEDPD